MIKEIIKKYKFDKTNDRLGPDCPFTHWKLYFKSSMKKICKMKFKNFEDSSEFRAGAYAITCSKISIGRNVIIRPNSMLFADPREDEEGFIFIGDNVMMGSGIHIYVANHKFDNMNIPIIEQGHYVSRDVKICEGAWIGANVVILPGVVIGKNSVVGAGTIVTKSVPEYTVFAGNPGKIIKELKSLY
ncbi:MAG: acyltransferase [Sulfurospirillaceae bacterium]|nr:acyltransferase [Sulfurospirillaceae bacterium]